MTVNYDDWRLIPAPDEATDLHPVIGGHPLVAQILAQREIVAPEAAQAFLDPDSYTPAPPEDLPDLTTAARLLQQAIAAGQRILIWGDFDVDGQTSTSLLLDALRGLDADVDFYIPHRLRESHGIQVARLEEVLQQTNPQILLTCDTGVSEHDAVEYANQRSLTVIITDHHDLPPTLPDAAAVVNPKRLTVNHPLISLPGVGVAYKLIEALYTDADRENELAQFLDLVALGIVADVAVQTDDTRYLLQKGLAALRSTTRPGLKALIDVANLHPEHISAEDIGFQIGPRLNAVGRLDDAILAVELLTTDDSTQARVIAATLDGLNKKRRVMQRQILAAAQELIAAQPDLLDHAVLVISHPEWHPGLLGIVAGQLAERYQRPCILLVAPPDEPLARGSARSSLGYDIGQAIADQAELLHTYGGHPGAAGVSLAVENIPRFRRGVSRSLRDQTSAASVSSLVINAEIALEEVTLPLVDELERLAPFGEGNPPVMLMAPNLTLARQQFLGRERLHRKLTVLAEGSEVRREVFWWNSADDKLPEGIFDLAFTASRQFYRGELELRLTLQALRLKTPPAVEVIVPERTIEDWRARCQDKGIVEEFRRLEPEGAVWAEGAHLGEISAQNRQELSRAESLLIYTAPPSSGVLRAMIQDVQPQRVYLLGILPSEQAEKGFLRRLLGLAKYAINHKEGRVEVGGLAAAMGQTESVVMAGLHYLAINGVIALNENVQHVVIAAPQDAEQADAEAILDAHETLRALLAETAAYRAFFSRAQTDMLLGDL